MSGSVRRQRDRYTAAVVFCGVIMLRDQIWGTDRISWSREPSVQIQWYLG